MRCERRIELVAKILRETRTGKTQLGNGPLADAYWQDRADIAEAFAERFAQASPRFDRERFLHDCGIPGHQPMCPDCDRPITLLPTGWWAHDGMPNGCWRFSMDPS